MQLNTIHDWLHWSERQFIKAKLHFGHGTDNAWDEAVLLVCHVLAISPNANRRVLTRKVTSKQQQQISALVQRRIQERIPIAYLTHVAWFAGLKFYVDERVLIPRSSIVELIMHRFAPWIESRKVKRILDVGTGSGCIAIACAKVFPRAMVDAADISPAALEVAQINVKQHRLTKRVRLIKSDVFASLKQEIYDIIIANPPYVGVAEMRTLPAEYLHEPKVALESGVDGLDVVRKLLREAAKHLAPHGILVVEVGNSEAAVVKAFPQIPFVWLEFERSEGGVFLITKTELEYKNDKFKSDDN